MSGIGTAAVREIGVGDDLQINVRAMTARIAADIAEGLKPLMIVGTAGTTSAGIVDPLDELADIAAAEKIWFHVDAAWGGGAAFVPGLRQKLLNGIERADSITFDAHKWLSAPMGAGVYLTRQPEILKQTFNVATGYMPRYAAGMDVIDPYTHSIQWTRRFIGLKVFMSLLVAGWDGYAEAINRQIALGDRLRQKLEASGWRIINRTPLPVICFAWTANIRKAPQRISLRPLFARLFNPAKPGFRSHASANRPRRLFAPASPVTAQQRKRLTLWLRHLTPRGIK